MEEVEWHCKDCRQEMGKMVAAEAACIECECGGTPIAEDKPITAQAEEIYAKHCKAQDACEKADYWAAEADRLGDDLL